MCSECKRYAVKPAGTMPGACDSISICSSLVMHGNDLPCMSIKLSAQHSYQILPQEAARKQLSAVNLECAADCRD